jgi:peptide/nickel transport system permease protein
MTQDIEAVSQLEFAAPKKGPLYALSRAWAPWKSKPLGVFGGLICLVLIFIAIFAPSIAPYNPRFFVGRPLEAPNSTFLFGTNNLGQDVFSRTIYGAQISMAVGIVATTLGIGTGTVLGLISGYFGGWADLLIQRGLEMLASLPGLVLALIIVTGLGRPSDSGSNVFTIAWQLRPLEIAIGVAFIFGTARIIRSAVLTERNMAYITAAESIGSGQARILWRHILPNVMPYVIVSYSVIIGIVIIIEASLSFLGYGASLGTPSWGVDLSNTNRQYMVDHTWLVIAPGVALSLTVMGFNFFGDALRDILDPRLRGSR